MDPNSDLDRPRSQIDDGPSSSGVSDKKKNKKEVFYNPNLQPINFNQNPTHTRASPFLVQNVCEGVFSSKAQKFINKPASEKTLSQAFCTEKGNART